MENAPTECGSDLLAIREFSKNGSRSRSVNNSLQRLDLDPNSTLVLFTSQSSAQVVVAALLGRVFLGEPLGY